MLDAMPDDRRMFWNHSREVSLIKGTTMMPEELPDDAHLWPDYDFKTKWEAEIFPLVRHDFLFAELVRTAVTGFVDSHGRRDMYAPCERWAIWTDSPLNYAAPNYAQCQRCEVVDEWLASDDSGAAEMREALSHYREYEDEFYELYEPLKIAYGPDNRSHHWFKLKHSCHWITVPMLRALTLLRPSHDIRIAEGDAHSCVVDLTQRQTFDILLADTKTNSIDFIRE